MPEYYCKSLTFMPHHLDVAVISYKFNELRQQGEDDHVVDVDPINISEADFKRLFYYTHHNHNTFAVNRQYPAGQEAKFYGYVSFAEQSVDNVLFNLGDEILDNIEADLGISRHMLSTCSLIMRGSCFFSSCLTILSISAITFLFIAIPRFCQ